MQKRLSWRILVGAAAIASPALADVTPPRGAQPAGAWMLDDELQTRTVKVEPPAPPQLAGAIVRAQPPKPPERVRLPLELRKRAEPRTDGETQLYDFVDDTLGTEELADRAGGRTVVKLPKGKKWPAR